MEGRIQRCTWPCPQDGCESIVERPGVIGSDRRRDDRTAPGDARRAVNQHQAVPPIEASCNIDRPFERCPIVARTVLQRMMCRQWVVVRRERQYVSERLLVPSGIRRMLIPKVQVPLSDLPDNGRIFDIPERRTVGSDTRTVWGTGKRYISPHIST